VAISDSRSDAQLSRDYNSISYSYSSVDNKLSEFKYGFFAWNVMLHDNIETENGYVGYRGTVEEQPENPQNRWTDDD